MAGSQIRTYRSARMVVSGTLPGNEIFTTGFWVQVFDPSETAKQLLDSMNGPTTNGIIQQIQAQNGPDVVTNRMAVYLYPPGAAVASDHAEVAFQLAGTAQGAPLPNQCSLVVSLRTSVPSARGRMYLPLTRGDLPAATHQVSNQDVDQCETNALSTFNAINALTQDPRVLVRSTNGDIVQRIIVDSRVDIQRRRANKQTIAYRKTGTVTL